MLSRPPTTRLGPPPVHKAAPPPRRGFTLVEVIAAVGIVTVLVSLMLPALSRARGEGQRVHCAAQMKELFHALFVYSEDDGGRLPYMGSYYASQKFAHPQTNRSWPAAIAPYLMDVWDVHRCASDAAPVRVGLVDRDVIPLPSPAPGAGPAPGRVAHLSYRGEERRRGGLADAMRPWDTVLLIEGLTQPPDKNDHFHDIVAPSSPSRRPGAKPRRPTIDPSFERHNGASHVLFYSGSVETVPVGLLQDIQARHLAAGLPPSLMP